VNEGLPPAKRIRVIAGDPPIDWSAVISPADEDMNDWHDADYGFEAVAASNTRRKFPPPTLPISPGVNPAFSMASTTV
jgi:hypothetical protein